MENISKKTAIKKKDSIFAIMHDLRNHLTSIGLSTEILLGELAETLNEEQMDYLKNIASDAKKIKELTEQAERAAGE